MTLYLQDIYSEDEDFVTLPSTSGSRVAEIRGHKQVVPSRLSPNYSSDGEQSTLMMSPVYGEYLCRVLC